MTKARLLRMASRSGLGPPAPGARAPGYVIPSARCAGNARWPGSKRLARLGQAKRTRSRKEVGMATTLTRWDPFADLADLRERLDRAFGEIADGDRAWAPRIDLVREKDRMVLRADLPGIKPEEVEITVEDGILHVSGKHEESKEEKAKHYLRRERRYGSFSRSLALPDGVDPERIEAGFSDGVLEVTIPVPSEKGARKVQIKPRGA